MQPDEQTIFDFFSLFEIPDGHHLLLWCAHPVSQQKISLFVPSAEAAVETLRPYVEKWNCYYGVGLRAHQSQPRPHWRGTEQDVTALLCLHLDIDIYHPTAHKNTTSLPKTIEEATALVRSLPVVSTVLVNSGHGLHANYILKEAEILADAHERNMARDAAYQLYAVCYHAAHMLGWRIDSVFDLSRILRIPGTINNKAPDDPKLVTLISTDGPRYGSISDISDTLPYVAPIHSSQGAIPASILSITQELRLTGGQFPFSTLKALCANDKKFDATWERKRADFRDGSQSAYDFSLILQGFNAGLSAQDCVSLVELFRREQKATDKSIGYYKFSVRNALLQISKGRKEKDAVDEIRVREEQATIEALENEQKAQDKYDPRPLFQEIETFFEFPNEYRIEKILRIESEPLQHEIVVNCPDNKQRRIQIESPNEAFSWAKMKERVMQVTSFMIKKGGRGISSDRFMQQWCDYFNRAREIAIDLQAPESFNAEIIRDLLERYAQTKTLQIESHEEEKQTTYMLKQIPFFVNNVFWFSLSKFMDYANRSIPKPYTRAVYVRILMQLSAMRVIKSFRVGENTTSRKYWYITLPNLNGSTHANTNESNMTLDVPLNVTKH